MNIIDLNDDGPSFPPPQTIAPEPPTPSSSSLFGLVNGNHESQVNDASKSGPISGDQDQAQEASKLPPSTSSSSISNNNVDHQPSPVHSQFPSVLANNSNGGRDSSSDSLSNLTGGHLGLGGSSGLSAQLPVSNSILQSFPVSSTSGETVAPRANAAAASSQASQIKITVSEPHKVGDGMGSYMVYTVTTKTTLPYFRRQSLSVTRRFSDFLGLHEKLTEKHTHLGRIVPPPPAKNAVGTAKIKLAKDEADLSGVNFLERRRAQLERYLQRNADHPLICADPDFREFLELDTELPRATGTSALSGAGVKRLFSFVGDTMSRITLKMDESDPVSADCCLTLFVGVSNG